jgi:DDE superfamily endonuclease
VHDGAAGREAAISHCPQLAAERLGGDRDAELLEDPLAKIDQPPAHNAVDRRQRPSSMALASAARCVSFSREAWPGAFLSTRPGCHLSGRLVVPPNITLVPLPPKCPELNPIENIWQFMRDNWLSNRIFKSYEDILDHCCYAWNKFLDQPWRIMCPSACETGLTVTLNENWY